MLYVTGKLYFRKYGNSIAFLLFSALLFIFPHSSHAQNSYELKVNMENRLESSPGWFYEVKSTSTPNKLFQISCGNSYSNNCSEKFNAGTKVVLKLAIAEPWSQKSSATV